MWAFTIAKTANDQTDRQNARSNVRGMLPTMGPHQVVFTTT